MRDVVLGIDVGTGSARAGVFTLQGRSLGQASHPIRIWSEREGRAEQSGEDIWRAVIAAVRAALGAAGEVAVRGIGFDATCSLVLVDEAGGPVAAGESGEAARNVIVWMDHRAGAEADEINAGGHEVLRYVGGRISLEMQTPKLLWLRRHLPESFDGAARFFDLPDYLTWRATGADSRSLCSTVCKWTYLGHEHRWDAGYFQAIGLGELARESFARLGTEVLPMGTPVGSGLSVAASEAFGLAPGIPVGTSAIDAHAGGLGVIGAALPSNPPLASRLALVGGTSSCHMAVSPDARFVPGVWGPYFSAMVPGMWLNEGGQSATGALIDHVICSHAAAPPLVEAAKAVGQTIYQALNARLAALGSSPAATSAGLHVLPDFHGNRSPRADASLRGMVSGLPLAAGPDELARLYLATVQALAYGTRHIVEALDDSGYAIGTVLACGGGTKNPVFLQAHADATGLPIVLAEEPEAVLLGSAMLGAVAAGAHDGLEAAMAAMSRAGRTILPDAAEKRVHDRRYLVFRRMHDDQLAYRALMEA